ncbi:hypothetical protein HZA40_05240 [Candidatus Peregrinibacteria bacterium]|nr:hypothetical protein [Candidatus Peregrinibacteria bacterium]
MKKILSIGMIAGALFLFAGCNKSDDVTPTVTTQPDVKTAELQKQVADVKKQLDDVKAQQNTETTTKEPTKTTSPNQQLIELYYNKLASNDFQGAYDMKKYKTMTLSLFEGWYKNLKATKFLDFIEVAPNQYDFLVELENKDGSKENYRVWMQVEGNLLNTISSNSTDEKPELRFVYGEDGDITTLFLVQNGNKTKIDTAKKSKYEEFNSVEISYGGDYLTYFKTGLEWNNGKIYDIKQNKVVLEIDGSSLHGFTGDMKHFYNCEGSGMTGGEVKTYAVPSFSLEKDLMNNLQVYGCDDYDKKSNTLKYTLSKFLNESTKKYSYSYDFNSGTVNEL